MIRRCAKMVEWFVKFRAGSDIEPEIIPVTIADTEALLNFLYQQIGCRSVETVRFGRSGTSVLVVDEEGLLKENPVPNIVGCALYPGYLVGNLILCEEGTRDGEPDIVGFSSMIEAHAAAQAAKTVALLKMMHDYPDPE